jgi:hypothetical protein
MDLRDLHAESKPPHDTGWIAHGGPGCPWGLYLAGVTPLQRLLRGISTPYYPSTLVGDGAEYCAKLNTEESGLTPT